MVAIKSVNEIIQSLIDYFKLAQPKLDTKPGTVARDLVVDSVGNQLGLLYEELSGVSDTQSYRLVSGSDLDKLAKNFGITRKSATPASGISLITFSSISAPININKGDLVIGSNGISYAVQNGVSVVPSLSNYYKSVASKYANDLSYIGISDEFAIEITVQATSPGSVGRINKYGINRTNIAGASNATNIYAFQGGSDAESDAVFRDRILSAFNGSSNGTALGYKNTAVATSGVLDAFVVEPGDPLMTRDGSIVSTSSDGTKTVISEGSGGKVDVVILGSSLTENIDTYIYQDKSNNNDPTDPKNDIVLGQIVGDENKTINRKRIDNIKNGTLPSQPVEEILEVTGSESGANFKPKSVDSYGRVTGNYELYKDTGIYGGCPWGFDTFKWVSNKVSDFEEDLIKNQYNGQDPLTFSDVTEISNIKQNISITNENSTVTSDRSVIQLLHYPATNVTRVFNVNTGERYIISNQNPDGSGSVNNTGRIKISGNTLPTSSDVLQVDYNWVVSYDQYSDYDGLVNTTNLRSVSDSIDWGYNSLVRSEKVKFTKNGSGTYFSGTVSLPISSIISVKTITSVEGEVSEVSSGVFAGRLSVVLNNLDFEIATVDNVKLKNTQVEVYSTKQSGQSFSNEFTVVGVDLRYITTIILPTDSVAKVGDKVTAFVNSADVYNITGSNGNFNTNQLTIPAANISGTASNLFLNVNYIANITNLLNTTNTFLPSSRASNGFAFNSSLGFNNNFITDISRKEVLVVQQNLSLQFYVELSLSSVENYLNTSNLIYVFRISDGKELWNPDHVGTIQVNNTNNNYQLILSGFNTPAVGDRVAVVYYSEDVRRFQPFTFANEVFRKVKSNIYYDNVNSLFNIKLQDFVAETGLTYQIVEQDNSNIIAAFGDGYIVPDVDTSTATFGSNLIDFSSIANLLSKKIKITAYNSDYNNGFFDILAYNSVNNSITIGLNFDFLNKNQVSVIRLKDGQNLWNSNCSINVGLNYLYLPKSTAADTADKVIVFYYKINNLRQSSTKLSVSVSDQIANTGVITAQGITLNKAVDIIFTATATGLKQNMSEAFRKALSLKSTSSIPSNVKLSKLAKLEKVNTVSIGSDEVLSVVCSYDLFNTKINDNSLFINEFIKDDTLGSYDFILPSTSNNTSSVSSLNSLPQIGDKFRATFYYTTTSDTENLIFTRNGTLYTNKNFALIDKVYISSGFAASQSTKIILNTFNQPIVGSRYKGIYDYIAPKQNERILIRSNYNKLITDTTFNIEENRPINADVIVRAAKEILVDITMNIVITDSKKTTQDIVVQNLKDALLSAVSSTTLGAIIDSSDLVNTAYTVEGVDRARILYFNKNGGNGQVLSLTAQKDEYFTPNNVIINIENR